MKLKSLYLGVVLSITAYAALAQDAFSPYYVVIGGFRNEENAKRYCDYAHEQNLPAVYAYNEERKLFYVYVRATQTREVAEDILMRLKTGTVFRDAWVFNGRLTGSVAVARKPAEPPAKTTPPVREEPDPPVQTEKPVELKPEPKPEAEPLVVSQDDPKPAASQSTPVGRPFVFKLIDKDTGEPLKGLIRVQESERAQQYRGYNSNELVYVPPPGNKSGKWLVFGQALGFRELKRPIDYSRAREADGAIVGEANEVIIPLALQRVRRGDFIEMTNVKFYNNAALLTPGSERELDQLVALMQSNQGYQIRLHGHTNGNEPRDIVSLGNSTDFFTPSTENAKSHVSAKELGLLRAELVKAYLVSKGIDASRISTKGEGGTQMIFDPSGTLAGLNDRVEVEIRRH